ncbi:MAG: BTAD domain-containing putative transcriptional regulator [Chloroflexota bacterium]
MSQLSLSFLGTFQAKLNDQPVSAFRSAKVQGLFIYLVLEATRAHSRDVLATMFWPSETEVTARKNLRQSLYQLRQVLPDKDLAEPFFLITRASVQFNQKSNHALDVAEFDQHLQQHQPEKASQLYEDTLLPGFTCDSEAFEDWLRLQRELRHRQALIALSTATEQALTQKETTQAQVYAQRQLQLEPWREEAHQQLMKALYFAGEKAAALRQYERCCQILEEELGIVPSAETKALYETMQVEDRPNQLNLGQTSSPESKSISSSIQPQAAIPDLYTTLTRLDPLPDQKLFGVSAVRQKLQDVLNEDDRPWLIAIDGMGGVGKTALANTLAHHFVEQERFHDVAWVSAKQEGLPVADGWPHSQPVTTAERPALDSETLIDLLLEQLISDIDLARTARDKRALLTTILKQQAYLVVIDNLETVADYQALLPFLRLLSKPSKFLITSRFTLRQSSDVFSVGLRELSQEDTLAFLRYEAETRSIDTLRNTDEYQLNEIYHLIWGNPLALKLVVGQMGFVPLIRILKNLTERKFDQTGALYNYLYRQGWQMLDEPAQQVLVTLLTNPNGTFTRLQAITTLPDPSLQRALVYLTALSLINAGGGLDEPRYYLHRLTETFLLQEIVGWQQVETPSSISPKEGEALSTSPKRKVESSLSTFDWHTYFQSKIQDTLSYWLDHSGISSIDIALLDQEREGIVQTLFFGLEVPSTWPVTRDLAIGFTPYMERRGHWEIWNRFLIQAIEQAKAQQDQDGQLTLTSLLARLYQRQSRPDQVIYYYRRVIHLARQVGNQFEMARACSNLGYLYIDLGYWWRSEVLCQNALRIFEALESDHGRAHTHNHLGVLYTRKQSWSEAESQLKRAYKLWDDNQDDWGLIYSFMNLSMLYAEQKNGDEVLKWSERALHQANVTGEELAAGTIFMNLGTGYRLKQQLTEAETHVLKAETIFRRYSNLAGLAQACGNLGIIYIDQGKWEKAILYLEEAIELFNTLNNNERVIKTLMDIIEGEFYQENYQKIAGYLNVVERRLYLVKQSAQYKYWQTQLKKHSQNLLKVTESIKHKTAG